LTEVRFKLLGLVPAVSVAVVITLLSRNRPGEGLSPVARSGIAILGFVVTCGLFIYDKRNSELYDDLISRGRKIEEELGIQTGQFLGRLRTSHVLIQHDIALGLIYAAAALAWVFAMVASF
jgi:hypothetical protein